MNGNRRGSGRWWLYAILSVALVAVVAPFVWMVLGSFKGEGELRQIPPTWWPQDASLDNYTQLFSKLNFGQYFTNSTVVAVVVTAGNLVFCSMLGYALAMLDFKGKRVIFVAVMTTLMIPGVVTFVPLFVLVAVAIRIESPGPVFFRQKRVGRGGRLFNFYKFRSMHADAEARRAELENRNEQAGPIFKMRDDPRITRIGRWIRRASIDELPQLWNVLRGDFSLVGPRPPTPDEVCRYELWQRRRLSVPGGLTCLWQVSGRSEIGFEDWMRLDMQYVSRRGWLEDLVLLVRTIPAVLSGRGAY